MHGLLGQYFYITTYLQKSFKYKWLLLHKQTFQCFSYFKEMTTTCCISKCDIQFGLQKYICLYFMLSLAINMATLMSLCLLLIYMTERGRGSHHSWGYGHHYLQWNILHLLDMDSTNKVWKWWTPDWNKWRLIAQSTMSFNNQKPKELWQLSHHYSRKLFYII